VVVTTEATVEFLGVFALCEAKDAPVDAIAIEGMAALTQRRLFAEEVHGAVGVSHAAIRGQRDLVRPISTIIALLSSPLR